MATIQQLREQALRAERLARYVLDADTVDRLLEASLDYRRQADNLEAQDQAASSGTRLCGSVAQIS